MDSKEYQEMVTIKGTSEIRMWNWQLRRGPEHDETRRLVA
jgi:hypothetical protein